MSQDQRHGRQLPLATSGITFNGVPLSPLTPAAAAVESDDDDVVIIDACNGKRKVGDGEEGRGSQGDVDDVVAVHGGGGGGDQACMFAERERERRRRMNDMFAGIRRLVPNLPEKSSKVEIVDGAIAYIKMLQGEEAKMEAHKLELQRERDRLALEVAAVGGGAGASSSAAAAVTVAAYGPAGGVASSSSSAAAAAAMAAAAARANTVVPQRARGATAPTPRPVAPKVGTWPLPAPAAMPLPPPPPAGGAVDRRAAPPPSLKTWSWGENVVVSVLGNIGNMTVRAPLRRTGVLAMASAALKRYNITAVTSLSGTDPSQTQNMFMFYTIIDMPDRQPQFVHPKVFEAMYRAAAAEIAAWINVY